MGLRTGFGQVHTMALPHKQGHAHTVLKQPDLLADRAWRHPHARRRRFEAAQTAGFRKRPQRQQWHHRSHHAPLFRKTNFMIDDSSFYDASVTQQDYRSAYRLMAIA
jgi:hypothetical protein